MLISFFDTTKPKKQQQGFTLVELMIASSVFVVILTISMNGFATMARFYQRGLYANRTQQTVRDVVAEIGATLQGTGGDVDTGSVSAGGVTFNTICIDTVRYMYRTESYNIASGEPSANVYEITGKYNSGQESDNVLISDTLQSKYSCSAPINSGSARVLLDQGFRLINFSVKQPADAALAPIYNITMNLVFSAGNNDSASTSPDSDYYYQVPVTPNDGYAACKGGRGRTYCYSANISTTVTRRITI